MNILRPKATAVKCGVVPITTRRWATDPKYAHLNFPKLVSLGDNSVGFIEEEIDEWLAARAAKRDDADARVAAEAAERDDVDADGNDAEDDEEEAA